eukprot:5163296-Prorocentrum_lima.AAC.1
MTQRIELFNNKWRCEGNSSTRERERKSYKREDCKSRWMDFIQQVGTLSAPLYKFREHMGEW